MSFDITAYESVASVVSTEWATRAVADSATAQLLIDNLRVQTGVKGSAAITTLNVDTVFQDATHCSARSPVGSTKLSSKRIFVHSLKDEQNYCFRDLYDTYAAVLLTKGQSFATEELNAAALKRIFDLRIAKIAADNEKALWIGDSAGTPSSNFTKYDGILTQLGAVGSGATTITPTGADITAKLQSIYTATPITIRHSDDFRLFMGQDTYDAYVANLSGRNLFNPQGTDQMIFGTGMKIFVAPGLNGTNKVVAARISDFLLGVDMIDDADRVEWKHSIETNLWYGDVYWAIGIAVVFPDEVGVASVA